MGRTPSVRWLSLVLALVVGLAAPASAQDAAAIERARQHYKKAEAARNAGSHAEAIREYEAAYAESAKPSLLFNIALSYETLGDDARAIDYFGRFLATNPTGDAATEAQVRKADLEKRVAAERATQGAARRARGLELLRTGKAADAVVELRSAHELTGDAELLFDLGEALRAAGQPADALAAFERYRADAPNGKRATEAGERIATLERERASTPPTAGAATAPATDAVATDDGGTDRRRRLYWYTGAVLAVTTGILLDQRDSSKNGELDGADFIAPGLYALGAGLVVVGTF
jgi:tetratricopeptide (TPR) repeat protein